MQFGHDVFSSYEYHRERQQRFFAEDDLKKEKEKTKTLRKDLKELEELVDILFWNKRE